LDHVGHMKDFGEIEGRNVLITGANGFVGSHLVDELVKRDCNVFAFVYDEKGSRLQNLEQVREEIEIIRGDLRDPTSVDEAIRYLSNYEDVLIFHLGAQAHVGRSWNRPYETIRTNVMGTLNLLESVRRNEINVEKLNVAGSSEEYGNLDEERKESYNTSDGELILNERSPVNPQSVYATSKVAADFLARNYYEAYGIPAVTTRMFNNFGPRQEPCYITSTVITQALNQKKVEVGNLSPKRDMCYIKDGVRGHISATLYGNPGEAYGFGYGGSVTMQEWVQKIIKLGEEEGFWKDVSTVQTEERLRPGDSDVLDLKSNSKKIQDLTGWSPQVDWEEGLRKTIKWYAENENEHRWR